MTSFWVGFEKRAGVPLGFLGAAKRSLSGAAGALAKSQTAKAIVSKSAVGTMARGAVADVAGRVAQHPGTAMGIAAGAAGGIAASRLARPAPQPQ